MGNMESVMGYNKPRWTSDYSSGYRRHKEQVWYFLKGLLIGFVVGVLVVRLEVVNF